jgi:hypothetical protein
VKFWPQPNLQANVRTVLPNSKWLSLSAPFSTNNSFQPPVTSALDATLKVFIDFKHQETRLSSLQKHREQDIIVGFTISSRAMATSVSTYEY